MFGVPLPGRDGAAGSVLPSISRPSVIVHRSQRAERLADALAELLRAPARGPLEAEPVVVGGRATERWLAAQLAQRLGIAANLRFLSPSTLVEELLAAALGPEAVGVDAWRGERLMWTILQLLPRRIAEDRFAPVRFYLGDAGPGSARAVGLARRVAECFARYAIARPAMVRAWDAGTDDGCDDATRWQPALWRAVRERLGAPHVAELADRFLGRLRSGDIAAAALPPRVLWMTHASVAPLHLEVLQALAAHGVPVHAFLLSPSREAVHRVRVAADAGPADLGHPLLESLWRPARDVERLLHELEGRASDRDVDLFDEPVSDGVLPTLQRELLAARAPAPPTDARRPVADTDRSLRVHACHGPMRQVEVMRDELLRAFHELPGLQPRDVAILTPSLELYAPLVDAVFSTRAGADSGGPPAIPVRVVGRPVQAANAAADVVLRALDLAAGRVDAVSVLDLLAVPAVAARFRFGEKDHETLRAWVRESNARCAIDADHRESLDLPAVNEHTWRFGLDRLLLGHAIAGEGRTLVAGVLPYDDIEGSIAELLGRFAEACERIFRVARSLGTARSAAEWRAMIAGVLAALVDEEDEAIVWPVRQLRQALDDLVENAARAGVTEPLELGAVRMLLDAQLAERASLPGGGAGAVALAALQGGRIVDARVVVLLGLDDGAFPVRRVGAGFDLLAREPRPGDPDASAEDRLRFLEAVMGARERLIVTHTGRSIDTNERIAPAVPVGELLDALDATFPDPADEPGRSSRTRARLVVEHPLQPFSPRVFDAAEPGGARGHDPVFLAGARRLTGGRMAPPPFVVHELPAPVAAAERVVHVDELARWLAEPARWLLQSRLKLRLDGLQGDPEVREPVALDGLGAWELRDVLLERGLAEPDAQMSAFFPAAYASGRLPHGGPGRLVFDNARREAYAIRARVVALRGDAVPEPVDVDVRVAGVRLVGRLNDVVGDGLLRWQAGSPHGKHLVELWVRHLALHLARPATRPRSVLVARADAKGNVWTLGPADDAAAVVERLLALQAEAERRPLPLFSETSRAYAECVREAPDDPAARREGMAAARKCWIDSWGAGGEGGNRWHERAFGGVAPWSDGMGGVHPDFHRAALDVWRPLFASLGRER